ncbi:MAG: tRNA pseudouridine synthase A [Clostridiales Family XIII bacterium]|jgi:tRNA pseudouridine38-40 synthase|nr:tRNA pseudouridine synthase A [Clostridiales Family XIII bacterium]
MTRNIRITIEYDGSAFRGWQVQREPAASGKAIGVSAYGESASSLGAPSEGMSDGGAPSESVPGGEVPSESVPDESASSIEAPVGGIPCTVPAERARTVQGTLEQALSRVCGEAIRLHGTSRTDAGVHALGQAASFKGGFGIPTDRIPMAVNHLLEDVRVLTAVDMPERFHARFDAKGKTYLYRIASASDIFLRNYRYLLNESLDECKMEQAAKHLIGTYDFAAFRTMGGAGKDDTVRTISNISVAGWDATDTKGVPMRETEIRVTGKSFMYNMVRIIAGTLIDVGLGKRTPADMARILASKDRVMAGHTAPAAGLYLENVYFE